MIITKPKQPKTQTLYEYMKYTNTDTLDISDTIWDMGACMCVDLEKDTLDKCEDYYDKLMLLLCLNIKIVKPQPDWYSVCEIAQFVNDNIRAFEKFYNEEYQEEYTPKYMLEHGQDPNNMNVDDGFYDIYMESFDSLLAGGYSERQYKKLFEYLTQGE